MPSYRIKVAVIWTTNMLGRSVPLARARLAYLDYNVVLARNNGKIWSLVALLSFGY
jgi:hypothetical protein